jgi:hypothetical protein
MFPTIPSCRRLGRHLARLRIVREQIRAIEHQRLRKFAAAAGVRFPHRARSQDRDGAFHLEGTSRRNEL